MNLIETPTAEAWVMPPGNLLITTVTEAGETCITLACTVPGVVDRPGAALIEMVRALALAKEHLVAVERKGR